MKFLDTFFRREPRTVSAQTERWAFLVLIVIGILIRTVTLSQDSLWVDEGYSLAMAQTSLNDLWGVPFDVHPPLYYTLLKPFLAFGTSEFPLRLLSVICGTATLIPIYMLSKRLFGNLGALTATALVDFSFTLLIYFGNGRNYALLLLLSITLMLALHRVYVDLIKADGKIQSIVIWIGLYYAAALAALYTHNTAVLYILFANLVIAVAALVAAPQRVVSTSLKLILLNLPVIIGWIPWLSVILATSGDFGWLHQAAPIEAIKTTAIVALPNRSTALGVVIAIGVILVGTLACLRRNHEALVIGVSHIAIFPLLIWGFGFFHTPVFMERTILPVAIGSAILSGAAIAYVNPKRIVFSLAALAVAANMVSTGSYLLRGTGETSLGGFTMQNWRDAIEVPLSIETDTAFIVCVSFSFPTANYYSRGSDILLIHSNGKPVRIDEEQWRFIRTRPVTERSDGFYAALETHIPEDQMTTLDWSDLEETYKQITVLGAEMYCNDARLARMSDELNRAGWQGMAQPSYAGLKTQSFRHPSSYQSLN